MRRVLVAASVALATLVGIGVAGRSIWSSTPTLARSGPLTAEAAGSVAPSVATTVAPTVVAPVDAPSPIVFLGDSITDAARDQLQRDFGADPTSIRAVGGARIDEMEPDATILASRRPEQVVINLGTNNVLQEDSPANEAAALDRVVSRFPDARCIHVVTINESMYAPPKDLYGGAVRLNDRLRAMAAADRRIRIVDWADIVRTDDVNHSPHGQITYDNVHPTAVGQQLLLDAYRRSMASC